MTIDVCEVCGSTNVKEIKCKVVCLNCGTILKTCSDLERSATELRTEGTRYGS